MAQFSANLLPIKTIISFLLIKLDLSKLAWQINLHSQKSCKWIFFQNI